MSRTVVVLCPNARREIIKVTPNSSILQVLEEACKKQNLNPEDYDLRHSNKALDLSLPIRFSNLPNNAQVELRPASNARKDSSVTVCVQLESGQRLTADFTPSATVCDVIEGCLKSGSIPMQDVGEPVCIYMRQKIAGDSIKTTTLRSLGLTKGQAIIRLLYRKPEELEQQAHVSSPLVAPSVQQDLMPHQSEREQLDSTVLEQIRDQHSLNFGPEGFKSIEIKMEPTEVEETPPHVQYSNWDSGPIKGEKTIGGALPEKYDYWESLPEKDGKTESSSHSNWGTWESVEEEKIAGEASSVECDNWDSLANKEGKNVSETSHADWGTWNPVPVKEQKTVEMCKTSPSVEYLDSNYVPTEEEKYTPTEEVEMECDFESQEEDTFQGIGDIKYIGERHAVVYSLDDITDVKKADLPDEFFEVTVNDVKYLLNEYKRERTELENQPLLTKEQRRRNVLQNLARHDQTVIRINFPERLVLQAVFSSVETVQTISDFIRNYLEDTNTKFYLYITPPKEILNPSNTILDAMLVPAAVIYFGCDSPCHSYLKKSLRDQLSDPRAASLAASESRKSNTSNAPAVELPSENILKEEKKLEDANPVSHCEKPQSSEKVPKWLKLSRK